MKNKNYYFTLLATLLTTLFCCIGLSRLPSTIGSFTFKKVDLFADIRQKGTAEEASDLEEEDQLTACLSDSTTTQTDDHLLNTVREQKRDSIYQHIRATQQIDSSKIEIEDFSHGHTGLSRFITSLNQIDRLERPVRIAFLGDSFIEGDILVADFRAMMQEHFGGRGVGFVPISSATPHFRQTVTVTSHGWKTRSILTDKRAKYTLSGLLFEPTEGKSTINFKTTNKYHGAEQFSSLKLLYSQNKETKVRLVCNKKRDTFHLQLPATQTIMQSEVEALFTDGTLQFYNTEGLQALGLAFEDNRGIIVDNFSLRGNSGLTLKELDLSSCTALREYRAYDLIVLQYGLNVATESSNEYGWYRDRMIQSIQHLQECFPEADILLLGISDRSSYQDGSYQTMRSVRKLLVAQREAAQQANIPYWSIYSAMGGENSMVRYVKNRWASKDYTHLSFRGGKEIGTCLYKALISEQTLYNETEERLD